MDVSISFVRRFRRAVLLRPFDFRFHGRIDAMAQSPRSRARWLIQRPRSRESAAAGLSNSGTKRTNFGRNSSFLSLLSFDCAEIQFQNVVSCVVVQLQQAPRGTAKEQNQLTQLILLKTIQIMGQVANRSGPFSTFDRKR